MTMRAGKLRQKVVIEQTTQTQDGSGATVDSWATFAALRASYEPLMGKELFAAQQEQANITVRFRVRYIAGVVPKMRLTMGGRQFNISSVIDPYGLGRELHLMCVEDV